MKNNNNKAGVWAPRTFDQGGLVLDASGNHLGRPFGFALQTHDGRTVDSTGAFLVGELERLDQTMHMPLVNYTWSRDIDLREDVSIADEVSSYTNSSFATPGGLGQSQTYAGGKSWQGKISNQAPDIGLDISKSVKPLLVWEQMIKYTILELESAAKLGRPIDAQKYEGLMLKYNMDVDAQVYVGDTETNATGLVNNASVSTQNVAPGVSGFTTWAQKSPDEILADFNTALTTVWQNSAWDVLPSRVLLPPAQYGLLTSMKVSNAGNESVMKYIQENNVLTANGKGKLDIFPVKWLIGQGAGGTPGTLGTTDRMVVYTKAKNYVRFPLAIMQRTPLQYFGLYQQCTYFTRLGQVETVYEQTLGYFDGI